MMKGTVFNIQKFCVHDGPGIRTTVFLKGCPLRCQWCHNPESNIRKPQLMFHESLCSGCGCCVRVCPRQAIQVSFLTGKAVTDSKMCMSCGACASEEVCEHTARSIAGRKYTVEEVIKEVLKDQIFYKSSGGGVTISGGEPLWQAEFTREILKACRENGIATAVETSGFASEGKARMVFEQADLLLFDVKHMDSREHRRLTGVGNEVILENLERAVRELDKKVWLRLPLIRGVNDSEEEICRVRDLALRLGENVEEIWLLAYHNLGLSKLEALGASTAVMEQFQAPEAEHQEVLKKILEESGKTVKTG